MSETAISKLIIGESPAIQHLRALIARVALTDLPVLIEGPTGAGKELVAQALHRTSGRSGAFVPFNVCAIAESMFEDALFGHIRGAFTGATADRPGYLAEAHRGTVFFDEIGGLPLGAQVKLLRAIETRQFRPVGGRSDHSSDFRVLAATNENLTCLVYCGRFRADLAHRLDAFVLRVPSLRERSDDIPALARHFLRESDQRGSLALSTDAVDLLQEQDWPGNVRELKKVIARAAALATGPVITYQALTEVLGASRSDGLPERRRYLHHRLIQVLEHVGWDIEAAAGALGVHRATVYRQLKRLRGDPPPRLSGRSARSVERPPLGDPVATRRATGAG